MALTVDLQITYANEAVVKLLGFSQKEMFAKKFHELFKIRDRGGNDLTLGKIDLSQGEVQISTKSGNFVNVNFKIFPLTQGNRVVGVMIMASSLKESTQAQVVTAPAL